MNVQSKYNDECGWCVCGGQRAVTATATSVKAKPAMTAELVTSKTGAGSAKVHESY